MVKVQKFLICGYLDHLWDILLTGFLLKRLLWLVERNQIAKEILSIAVRKEVLTLITQRMKNFIIRNLSD